MPARKSSDSTTATLVPTHVAIIMDGNGRWAKARGKARIIGHRKGAEKIEEIMRASQNFGIKYLTLYAFSSENWNRPKSEVDALMSLLTSALKKNFSYFIKNEVRFRTIGDISVLPKKCVGEIEKLTDATKHFSAYTLVLALNYGARDELVRAVKSILKKIESKELNADAVNWDIIAQNLDTKDIPDPDLLIRTSGEMRLSNYLLLQSAYSELYFTKTYWPDFDEGEFRKAIEEYQGRERRYGLTTDQLKK